MLGLLKTAWAICLRLIVLKPMPIPMYAKLLVAGPGLSIW
jgi:hypothetical protein